MSSTLARTEDGNTLRDALLRDFALASVEFSKARRKRRTKDSPAHRIAVESAADRIDAVLDMYLAMRDPGAFARR